MIWQINNFISSKKTRFYILLLAIFSLALAARLIPGARTIDDAYITYRYARNILSGEGFVYNPGERVLGTTTPLYTAVLVVFAFLSGGANALFPVIAMCINAIADGLTCLLLLRLGNRLGFPLAGMGAALVWAVAPFSVTFAIGGLETSLYVLILVALAIAVLEERHFLLAILAALAILTRPDALILIGPVVLERAWQVIRDRRENAQGSRNHLLSTTLQIIAFLVPTLAWILFSTYYFGSPIPHSILAKSLAYRLPPHSALIRLLQHYATPFLGHLTFGTWWIGVGIFLYPTLYLFGSLKIIRLDRRIWPFLAYPWLYFATFSLANPLIFRWYLTPPLPFYFLVILIGASQFISDIALRANARTSHPYHQSSLTTAIQVCLVLIAPMGLSLRGWDIYPDHGPHRSAPNMAWFKLELLYRQAADLLTPEVANCSEKMPVLAAGDVGVLGYYTPFRILDTVGLNSPQSTQYYPLPAQYYANAYAVAPNLILDLSPDFIVIMEVYGREGLLKDPRFWQAYVLMQKISTDIYGSDGMLIFKRKSP